MLVAEASPLQLHQSWPLFEQSRHFELGLVLSSLVIDAITPNTTGELGLHHAGCWDCDLSNQSLSWSGGVYDLFGMPRQVDVERDYVLPVYTERSRAAMERLRAYAIRHKRGFTLDIELSPPVERRSRWARLIAAPVCQDGKVVRLHGLKVAI